LNRFTHYIIVYQMVSNEIQSLGETQSETQKVTNFLDGITNRSFKTIKTVIKSSNKAYDDFKVAKQRIKHLYEKISDQEVATQRVTAVSTASKKKQKDGTARGGGCSGGRGRGWYVGRGGGTAPKL
jgi:hypothetical protein